MAEKATSGSLNRVAHIEGNTLVMEDDSFGSPEPSSSSGGDGRLVSSGDDISQGEDESTYDSGESDEKSTTVTKSNEEKSYEDDDETGSSHYSDFLATEDPQRGDHRDEGEVEVGGEAATAPLHPATAALKAPVGGIEPSASSYSYGDDFMEEENSVHIESQLPALTLTRRDDDLQEADHPMYESSHCPTGEAESQAEGAAFPTNKLDVGGSRASSDEGVVQHSVKMEDDGQRPTLIGRRPDNCENVIEVSKTRDLGEVDRAHSASIPVNGPEIQHRVAIIENVKLEEQKEENSRRPEEAELEELRAQIEAARAMIMSSLDIHDGGDDTPKNLVELVLLAESQGYNRASRKTDEGDGVSGAPSAGFPAIGINLDPEARRGTLEHRVKELEEELARVLQECREHQERADSLERRLESRRYEDPHGAGGRGSEMATADILALKAKATQLVDRLRQEKVARLKAEGDTRNVAEKVQVLSNHIEKLMVFLKHEAAQKAKAHEQQRRLQKELELVKARSTALLRSNQAKDRVMTELEEGSNILEDQLRLMDEKYMELRTKLDWTRQKAGKEVRRARAQASALRTKWALLCQEGKGGENSLLDCVELDVVHPPFEQTTLPAKAGQTQEAGAGAGTGAPERGKSPTSATSSHKGPIAGVSGDSWLGNHSNAYHQHRQDLQRRRVRDERTANAATGLVQQGRPTARTERGIGPEMRRVGKSGEQGQGSRGNRPGGGTTVIGMARLGWKGHSASSQEDAINGKAASSPSDASKLTVNAKTIATSGGDTGLVRCVRGGGVRGDSPNGMPFAPVLSAGSDPGGGMLGGVSTSGGRGVQRSPWGEQGNARAATAAASVTGTPQILFA